MMSDSDILKEMIHEDAKETLQQGEYGKPQVTLREKKEESSDVTIKNVPKDAVIIKVDDRFRSPGTIFKGDHGECKRADYVIISEEKKRILYIEIKLTTDEDDTIVRQLMGAQCFVKYCQVISSAFWSESNFLRGYENRFVCIKQLNAKKKTVTTNPHEKQRGTLDIPDTPQKHMRIAGARTLQFNELAWLGVK